MGGVSGKTVPGRATLELRNLVRGQLTGKNLVVLLQAKSVGVAVSVLQDALMAPINAVGEAAVLLVQLVVAVVADNRQLLALVIIVDPLEDRLAGLGVSAQVLTLPHIADGQHVILARANSHLLQALRLELEGGLVAVGDDGILAQGHRKAHANLTTQTGGNDGLRLALGQLGVGGYNVNQGGCQSRNLRRVLHGLVHHVLHGIARDGSREGNRLVKVELRKKVAKVRKKADANKKG